MRKISMSQGSHARTGGCTSTLVCWEVTIGITVQDGMSDLRKKGAGGEHLRHELRVIFGTICCQESIDGPKLRGTVKFEFKRHYKTPGASHERALVHLRFE